MNELLADTRFWLVSLGAALLALIRYLWKRQERRLDALEADAVRKDEIKQLRQDMQARHEENRETLARIDASTTGTHERIDALYRDLMRKPGGG
jgi:hypothetical protein